MDFWCNYLEGMGLERIFVPENLITYKWRYEKIRIIVMPGGTGGWTVGTDGTCGADGADGYDTDDTKDADGANDADGAGGLL